MKQNRFLSNTTPISRIFRSLFAAALAAFIVLGVASSFSAFADEDTASRRSSVKEQFARAESLRAALEAKPERERSLKDYTQVVSAYRRVMLITPRAPEVPQAIKAAADLYRRMGQEFGHEYFDSATQMYQFLRREYPSAHASEDALFALAEMNKDDLGAPDQAKQSYQDFLKHYPHSEHAADARKALAEIAASKNGPAPAKATQASAANGKTSKAVAASSAADKTTTSAKSAADVPVPVPAQAPVQIPVSAAAAAASIPTVPPKVETVARKSGRKTDQSAASDEPSEVSSVRVWNADTYTRIVIDLGGQAKYQAARISDPDRIYFDIEGATLSAPLLKDPIPVPNGGYLKSVRVAQNRADTVRVVLDVTKVKDYSVFELADPDRLVVDVYGPSAQLTKITSVPEKAGGDAIVAQTPVETADAAAPAPAVPAAKESVPVTPPSTTKIIGPAPRTPAASRNAANTASAKAAPTADIGTSRPSTKTPPVTVAMGPPSVPQRTRAGEQSLTRALGLKIGRIVIDAGHGGHDTGTIGPTGLMEKDLCLDVALRLGKLIQQRIPSAEVTFTRDDDTFVPLEQRTAIANDAKADLFLSIHANSSSDHHVSGIETYYLNFNASPAAMEVAARENAVGQSSVHDLQDLVNKIARNEKIEESRDFAGDIQDSLAKHVDRAGAAERNRGVRKAPFVVLIGADMPSVLAEISFLSNPADEQWLKKPDNRQRVAEGLYRGIESYLHSTNSLKTAPLTASSETQ